MIEYLIGVDGGGTGTRLRLARADGTELAQAETGPSGLMHGIGQAWATIDAGMKQAFAAASLAPPPLAAIGIGLGLAGVHNKEWAAAFLRQDPGYGAIALESDALTTLLGAHQGQPGAIVALGTGSVGEALYADGTRREVGGWGFPVGDEAGGAWIGVRAISHMQHAMDGRAAATAFSQAVADACGGARDAIQVWLANATQTAFARLAPIVLAHAATSDAAAGILAEAGREAALIAQALDPDASLPVALCGGLAQPLRPYLPPGLLARVATAHGDSAAGALRLIAQKLHAGSAQASTGPAQRAASC
jgi:glucosamine kinase